MSEAVPLSVRILDQEYRVLCPVDEQSALEEAALLLDGKMRTILASGKSAGVERIAVMAALNLAHESMRQRDAARQFSALLEERLQRLTEQAEAGLKGAA